jgi:hypothetical protein
MKNLILSNLLKRITSTKDINGVGDGVGALQAPPFLYILSTQ